MFRMMNDKIERTKRAYQAALGERRARALELKRAGLSYREIGTLMGVSRARAAQLVNGNVGSTRRV